MITLALLALMQYPPPRCPPYCPSRDTKGSASAKLAGPLDGAGMVRAGLVQFQILTPAQAAREATTTKGRLMLGATTAIGDIIVWSQSGTTALVLIGGDGKVTVTQSFLDAIASGEIKVVK